MISFQAVIQVYLFHRQSVLPRQKKSKGEKGKVIAVIGDGALTGGLAFEAFNNGVNGCENLIVILNDNKNVNQPQCRLNV